MTNPLVLAATYNKLPVPSEPGKLPDFLTREHGKIESALKFATSLAATVFNVLDFGADPTGARDSTAKIQAAINAAGAGGCLLFPEGIYACVGLTSSANGQQWIGL